MRTVFDVRATQCFRSSFVALATEGLHILFVVLATTRFRDVFAQPAQRKWMHLLCAAHNLASVGALRTRISIRVIFVDWVDTAALQGSILVRAGLQGNPAHKKQPPLLGPP